MASTQVISATIGFDGAGNPTTATINAQFTGAAGVTAPLGSLVYQLNAADKAALAGIWANAKAALGLP
jgi:hypothetical protein